VILIDTDIVIDYLRRYEKGLDFIKKHKEKIAISDFLEIELIIGCRNKEEIKDLEEFLKKFSILNTNSEIIKTAVDLLKNHYLKDGIEAIDSIIAASALFYDIDFYTRNSKHFKNIKGLRLFKPY